MRFRFMVVFFHSSQACQTDWTIPTNYTPIDNHSPHSDHLYSRHWIEPLLVSGSISLPESIPSPGHSPQCESHQASGSVVKIEPHTGNLCLVACLVVCWSFNVLYVYLCCVRWLFNICAHRGASWVDFPRWMWYGRFTSIPGWYVYLDCFLWWVVFV